MPRSDESGETEDAVKKRIREAGERAKAEADARRKAAAQHPGGAREVDGRDGPDPVRYGDWEKKGLASDF
jgi:hypothetical protein